MTSTQDLLDADTVERAVVRMGKEMARLVEADKAPCLIGVRRGGVPIAARLSQIISDLSKKKVDVGTLDITLYRDDAATALPDPKIGPSEISFAIDGRDVIIVDDVLQTGRTVRAAIDALLDYGRPRRIWLAVLLDRGGRELPVAADFVGRVVEVAKEARIDVRFEGTSAHVTISEGTL